MADAPPTPLDASDIVPCLRSATQRRDRLLAANCCATLVRLKDEADNVAVAHAGAATALADVLAAWPNDAIVSQSALCALFHSWGGGVKPFDNVAVPTERIVQAVVGSLRLHQAELYTAQATMRLLKMHTASAKRLILLPTVVNACQLAMRAFPNDDSVQHWGATTLCHVHAIGKDVIVQAHGGHAYETICATSMNLAAGAPQPATLFVGAVPWFEALTGHLSSPSTNES